MEYFFKNEPTNKGKYEVKLKDFIPPNEFKELKEKMEELGGEYQSRVGFVFDEKPDLTPILGEPIEDPSIEREKKRKEREERERIEWENERLWRERTFEDTIEEFRDHIYEQLDGEKIRYTFNVPVIGEVGKFKTGELKDNDPSTSLTLKSYVRKWGYIVHTPAFFEVDNGYAKTETVLNHEGAIDPFRTKRGTRYAYYFWVKEKILFNNKNELKRELRSIKDRYIVPSGVSFDEQIVKAIASNPHQSDVFKKYLNEFF